jgi:hypothetical protein
MLAISASFIVVSTVKLTVSSFGIVLSNTNLTVFVSPPADTSKLANSFFHCISLTSSVYALIVSNFSLNSTTTFSISKSSVDAFKSKYNNVASVHSFIVLFVGLFGVFLGVIDPVAIVVVCHVTGFTVAAVTATLSQSSFFISLIVTVNLAVAPATIVSFTVAKIWIVKGLSLLTSNVSSLNI